jgi:hypothetical protein
MGGGQGGGPHMGGAHMGAHMGGGHIGDAHMGGGHGRGGGPPAVAWKTASDTMRTLSAIARTAALLLMFNTPSRGGGMSIEALCLGPTHVISLRYSYASKRGACVSMKKSFLPGLLFFNRLSLGSFRKSHVTATKIQ